LTISTKTLFEEAIMTERVYNFNPGPAVLPLPVLEEAQRDLIALPGVGMSILEISHRSKTFEGILAEAQAGLRKLLGIPENYHILFQQGGATAQFYTVPLNLLGDGQRPADYILTGSWSQKAFKEAKKVPGAKIQEAGSTEKENFKRIPRPEEWKLDPNAAYVHFTSNNTIFGTQWTREPEVGDVPLVCDASSDILSRPLDFNQYALLYAGAQKNMGPAGVTVVILRNDLLQRIPKGLPVMMDYSVQVKDNSLHNTPPCFAIYIVNLVCKWLLNNGGLAAMQETNRKKADLLYSAIDNSDGFYRGTADKDSRSQMNITFRMASEEMEDKFVKAATAAGFVGLKGHRSVGGMRASIYNAFPLQGVVDLTAFMQDFAQKNG
jgi:phosphoserine aminotransferase